jgi:Flp/Fap pilin component
MKNVVTRLCQDESGVTAIEYGLIAALISVVLWLREPRRSPDGSHAQAFTDEDLQLPADLLPVFDSNQETSVHDQGLSFASAFVGLAPDLDGAQ